MPIKKKKIVEKVIAFEGEQDFIINPNKPEYISAGEVLYVEAQGGQTSGGTSGGAIGDAPTGGTGTPQSVSYLIPEWNSFDCTALNTAIADLTGWLTTNSVNLPPAEVTYYQTELGKAKDIYKLKCTNIKPPVEKPLEQTNYPTFTVPDWSSLTCEAIKTKVTELKKYISDYDSKFITLDRLYYESALENALSEQNRKCAVTPPTPPAPSVPPTPPVNIINPPRFFGGGGGGFGSSPEVGSSVVNVKKKQGVNWLLLLLVAGGIYLFVKKKK